MNDDEAVRSALAREEARSDALIRGDVEAVGDFLADEFAYVHASGKIDDRASYLAFLGTGAARYTSIRRDHVVTHAYGDVVVLTAIVSVEVVHHGEPKSLRNRLASVWVREGPSWRLVLWQLTATPD